MNTLRRHVVQVHVGSFDVTQQFQFTTMHQHSIGETGRLEAQEKAEAINRERTCRDLTAFGESRASPTRPVLRKPVKISHCPVSIIEKWARFFRTFCRAETPP
jgi:hypothetical protein